MAEQLVEIFHDIMWMSAINQNQYEDSLTNLTDVFEVFEPTEHEERKKKIAQFDPVYQTHIHHFVQAKLSELCSQIGAESFASMVSTADKHIVKNLQDFISI